MNVIYLKMCIVLGHAFKPCIQYHVKDMNGSLWYTLEIKNLFHKIVSTSQKYDQSEQNIVIIRWENDRQLLIGNWNFYVLLFFDIIQDFHSWYHVSYVQQISI